MNTIKQNFSSIKTQIRQAEITHQRVLGSVQLLAVSKTKPVSDIMQAYQLGQRHFGENYLQEALSKQQQLSTFNISWHFIGPIQSNKTKAIASHFHWVHSVDRLKIAQRLNGQRPDFLPPLNICLQVNISEEDTKAGVKLTDLATLISQVQQLPNLRLRGVMAIPAPQTDYELQCQPYRHLYQLVQSLHLPSLDTFSYGMSDDLEAAIAEGATIVRIGTALFGSRN
jgi:pyridoxal phosphate enzyme (YggS family)